MASKRLHSKIYEAQEQLRQGLISRRDFLRTATLLGASFGAAQILAACGGGAATEAPPAEETGGEEPAEETSTSRIKRGGTLRFAEAVQAIDHPARLSWTEGSNQMRQVFEYLTLTDRDNVTHPYLLESWEPNADLTVWELRLRQGINWTNGDEFVADHVKFNFGEWLNPDVGSSILGFFEGIMTIDDVEVVDDYTVRLNLARPKVDVPENLFHYPALIMHPDFDGDASSGSNPHTGPFRLIDYRVGERVRVERRDDYWQMGEDGEPLPYLDAIEFIDLGTDQTASVAAVQAGEVDGFYDPTPDSWLAMRNDDRLNVLSTPSAQVRLIRMRVDQAPYDNNDVRTALKKVMDRQRVLEQAYFGQGITGPDAHVSPVQPDFAPMEGGAYDPEGAKELLAGAGYPDGIDMSIAVGTGWTDVVAIAETLQQDAEAGGINLTLETMPTDAYWSLWTETPLGITPWTHRPLAVMLLPLAYIGDADGNPVPWNETRWIDEEFTTLLADAQGVADSIARQEIMAELQRIQVERGPLMVPYWRSAFGVIGKAFQDYKGHPVNYELFTETWYDPDQDPF